MDRRTIMKIAWHLSVAMGHIESAAWRLASLDPDDDARKRIEELVAELRRAVEIVKKVKNEVERLAGANP